MANTPSNITKHNTGVDYILKAVKGSKNPVSRQELQESFEFSKSSFARCIKELDARYPKNFKHRRVPGSLKVCYVWEESEENPAPMIYKYDFNKTEEGYSDPTAAAAMKTMENDFSTAIRPGGIYNYNNSVGKTELVLVLAVANGRTTSLPLIESYTDIWEKDIPEAHSLYWGDSDGNLMTSYYCPSKMGIKPLKYFSDQVSVIAEKALNEVKYIVASYLDLPASIERVVEVPVEKIVEKVVEKEVPVEVEKIVEKIVEVPVEKEPVSEVGTLVINEDGIKLRDTDALSLALAKQKAEIYQDILEKLIAAKIV